MKNILAQAQGITNPAISKDLQGLSGESFLGKLISTFISVIFVAGAIVFIFLLLLGGIKWMTAGGDKAAIEQARGRITSALIGLLILFVAFALIKVIETMFGIKILTINLDSLIISK